MKVAALACVVAILLSACGEGYVLEPGRIVIRAEETGSRDRVFLKLSDLLKREGFEDLGRYDEMIDLISTGSMEADLKERQLTRLRREYNYINRIQHFNVTASDFTDVDLSTVQLRYEAPYEKFVEVAIYEERPGGFSSGGHALFQRVRRSLQGTFPKDVVVVSEPPPTNEAEHRRITTVNVISSVIAWCVALGLSLAVIGIPLYFLTKKVRLPVIAKRTIFSLVCAWLVTPVPLPATIVTVPGPNLFLLPWTDFAYYKAWGPFVPVSFAATLTVCVLISLRRFRGQLTEKDVSRVDA